jgi:hypothetical protein
MKKILTIIFVLVIFVSTSLSQAYKIDDVDEANEEIWTASADYLRNELQQKPDAKGYIIIYRGENTPLGFPIRLAERLRNHFINYLLLPPERFEILIGGQIEKLNTEIWIVPAGSNPPLDKSVIEKIDKNKSTQFDNFNYPHPSDGMGCCSIGGYTKQEKTVSLDKFAQLLREHPDSIAFLIVYGQYCITCAIGKDGPIIFLDSQKVINRILRKEKNIWLKTIKLKI